METIKEAFNSEDRFNELLRRLSFPVANVNRLIDHEGINTANTLANTRLEDLETSMTSVNRLFGNHQTPARRIYFAPVRMLKLKALAAYLKRCLDTFRIPDIRLIETNNVDIFVQNYDVWIDSSGDIEDVIKKSAIKFEPTKFVKFREKIETLTSSVKGVRGINLDYLTRDVNPLPLPSNYIEDANPDVNSLDFMRLNATHFGPEFDKDNQGLFTLLRNFLTGTDGWNIIAKFQRNKDGRNAYLALREHYEGASFHDLIRSRANNLMLRTFYRGDTTKFNWERFVAIHLEAHQMFDNIKEPLPDSIKILNFKAGIRPEAGLESALDVARGLPNVGNNFDNFVNNITEGVINRRSRREMFRSTSNTREVAAFGRSGRDRGGRGRGRGRGRGGRGRGRGRGRYNYRRNYNTPDKIIVEGKELYPFKSYSNDEYQELNYNQKNELRKARLGNHANTMDKKSISAALTKGIREAFNTNNDSASTIHMDNRSEPMPTQLQDDKNVNVSSTITTATSTDQLRSRRRRG